MDMSMGTHVKECGFNFDVAPSLVQTKCPIYLTKLEKCCPSFQVFPPFFVGSRIDEGR